MAKRIVIADDSAANLMSATHQTTLEAVFRQLTNAASVEPGVILDLTFTGHNGRQLLAA